MTDLRTPPVNDGDLFSERARQYSHDRPLRPIQILEAGCGWGWGLDLRDREREVTGVDTDTPALRAHTREREDLDSWHLGDLRTVPMPPRAYDVVHAPYLIERVQNAELVLDRFVAALKPGGLLLVRLRDRNTAFGFLDRTLPAWLRGPVWNRLAAREQAGAGPIAPGSPAASAGPDAPAPEVPAYVAEATARFAEATARIAEASAPPPAIYEKVASRAGMQWYCVMRGLVIAEEYASRDCLKAFATGSGLAGALCRLVATVSRGRLTADHSEVTLVIRKPENRFARVI
ncbi:class I SAM-dependent methyltransferase [Actinomadura barringtoniae]|uniref:class I SAM-dependent methyltransferase n=1 Tax=Actinomadura barringtoniae TaxID=1427535 RepID=UPI0027DDF78F|nr:methyltransferase domain-containing protein [Actinomadura barringtoniae]